MDIEEIKKLPTTKRIILAQEIWDSIPTEDIELANAMKKELKSRLDRLEKRVYVFKQARKHLNLTQGDIAESLGTDQGTISKIERGKIVGPYFVSYLKFLEARKIDLNKVIQRYEHTPQAFMVD